MDNFLTWLWFGAGCALFYIFVYVIVNWSKLYNPTKSNPNNFTQH